MPAWCKYIRLIRGLGIVILILGSAYQASSLDHPRKVPAARQSQRDNPATIAVGRLILNLCGSEPRYCGSLPRPLDPSGKVAGLISIAFEYYPRLDTANPSLGTIVAVEGGPGYPSTASRDGYLELFAPLLQSREMLLVDLRGTGGSAPIECHKLQRESTAQPVGIRQCGAFLGKTAYLYGSGLAADDMAAILEALGIHSVDLYGDSYGTFFSQTFAGRHPDLLRSVVLDSAYPPVGQSPWYPEIAPTARFAFDAACQRSETCRSLPGFSMERIRRLLQSIRSNPLHGSAPDGNGVLHWTTVDATALDYLMVSNGTTSVVYRELDAAARAFLESADPAPLLRLVAENNVISASGPSAPQSYSEGLFLSVSCTDYPQIYDMSLPVAPRHHQRDQVVQEKLQTDPNEYAPFTIPEFAAGPLDTSVLDLCLDWPAPDTVAYPPGHPVPANAQFTQAPVLVLSGDLDSLTPALQGKHAAELFAHAQQLIVENSFHVTAVGDEDNCASLIVRRFIADLDPGDTSCTSRIAEVHLLPAFVRSAADLDPAVALPGNEGDPEDLRIARAAAYAVGDVLSRWWVNSSGNGIGLRGGRFHYVSPTSISHFSLDGIKWTDDVSVTGTVSWDYLYPGLVDAHVAVRTLDGRSGELTIRWLSRIPGAHATIHGNIGKHMISAGMYAP